MGEQVKPYLKVGDAAPLVSLPGMDGQPLELSSLWGKKCILFMWASW